MSRKVMTAIILFGLVLIISLNHPIQPYFRLPLMLLFGLLIWTLDLVFLNNVGISTTLLLNLNVNINNLVDILLNCSILTCLFYLSFFLLQGQVGEERAEIIPLLMIFTFLGILFFPLQKLYYNERMILQKSLYRIAFGSVFDAVPFSDVIFADILTSFAKIFGDLQIIFTDLLLQENMEHLVYLEILVPILTL